MQTFAIALTPILMLILLGYGLKRALVVPEQAWAGMEKLTYFVLFPALLIYTLGRQTLDHAPWVTILVVVLGTLLMASLGLILWRWLRPTASGPTFTSVFQGGVRFNTYIALAVAQAYYGAEGLALGAVAAGFMIVLINLLCVCAFALWGRAGFRGIWPLSREILGNPLILSCAVGWLLSLSGVGVPELIGSILEILARAALPLGLLAVGAALRPEAVAGHWQAITASSVVQFGLKPVCVLLLTWVTGLGGVAAGVLIIAFMTPTAPSAAILARQLGGDMQTMASIITAQTLMAFVLMPLIAAMILN